MSFDMAPQVHRLVNALLKMRETREKASSLETPKDVKPQAPESEIDHLNLRASRVIDALENPQNLSPEDLVFGIKFGLDTLMEWHEEWAKLVGGSNNGGTQVTATRASSHVVSAVPSAPPPQHTRSTSAPTFDASAAPTRSTRNTRTTDDVNRSAAAFTQAHSVMAAGPSLVAPPGHLAPENSTPLASASAPAPAPAPMPTPIYAPVPAPAPMPTPIYAPTQNIVNLPDMIPPVRRKRGRPRKDQSTAASALAAAKTPAKATAGSSKGIAKGRVEKARKTPPAAVRKGRGTGTRKAKEDEDETESEEANIEAEVVKEE